MIGYSSLNTYFDEDELPPGQAPILTKGVELVRVLVEFLLAAKQKTGYSMMGVVTGPSGVGKSIAIQTVLNALIAQSLGGLPMCLKIKAKPDSSPRQLLEDLLAGFGEKLRRLNTNRFKIADQAAEAIFTNNLKLLVVDNAEQLDAAGYEFLCYLFDKTGCPILVIGLQPIVRVIMQQEKFVNRVKQQLDFPCPSEDEVLRTILPQLTIPYWTFHPDAEKDQVLGKKLWISVAPSLRSLRGVLQNACLLADLQEDKHITPALVVQGFHMAPIRKRPGGLDADEEREEEQAPQTEYEEESVRRQRGKQKDNQQQA